MMINSKKYLQLEGHNSLRNLSGCGGFIKAPKSKQIAVSKYTSRKCNKFKDK